MNYELSDKEMITCRENLLEQIPRMYDSTEEDKLRAMYVGGWQECRRRVEANRWLLFSDEELDKFLDMLASNHDYGEPWYTQIATEQERRKAEGGK